MGRSGARTERLVHRCNGSKRHPRHNATLMTLSLRPLRTQAYPSVPGSGYSSDRSDSRAGRLIQSWQGHRLDRFPPRQGTQHKVQVVMHLSILVLVSVNPPGQARVGLPSLGLESVYSDPFASLLSALFYNPYLDIIMLTLCLA